jgi:hypothetical protein
MLHAAPVLRTARGRDVGTGADPGYSAPSSTAKTDAEPEQPPASLDHTDDPFPLPFDPRLQGLSLSSKSQTDKLPGAVDWEGGPPPLNADEMDPETPVPLRVPGRGPDDETREKRIARLVYQARKRGTLETDLLLSTFARDHLHQLPDAEVIEFDLVRQRRLLCSSDFADIRDSSSTSPTGTSTTGSRSASPCRSAGRRRLRPRAGWASACASTPRTRTRCCGGCRRCRSEVNGHA